jgi:hypothetical protein
MVRIILTASSGVAAQLRTGSQPIPSKLNDKIGEQATTKRLWKYTQIITLDHLAGVEYASRRWYQPLILEEIPWSISFHTNESIRVQSGN